MSDLPYNEDEINHAMEIAINADRAKQAVERLANRIDRHPTERGRLLKAFRDFDIEGKEETNILEEDPRIFELVALALEASERKET